MSAADWYARKLGGVTQHQQVRTSTPPMQQGAPAVPAYVPPYQPASPYGQPQAPQQVSPGGAKHLSEILHRPEVWQGRGDAVKANEKYACPNCGSEHFFVRNSQSKMNASGILCAPAPSCESCGYNGLYEQFGAKLDES